MNVANPLTRRKVPRTACTEQGEAMYRSITPMLLERIEETGRLILVHSGACWNATGGGQRPQQLAEVLAQDAAVIHLAGGNGNMRIQADCGAFVRNVLEAPTWLRLKSKAHVKVFLTAFPDHHADSYMPRLGDDWFKVYDCIDDWGGFATAHGWYGKQAEEALVRHADFCTASAQRLVEHCEALGARDVRLLRNSTRLRVDGGDWQSGPREGAVFVGTLAEQWIDFDLFRAVARKHKLTIIGDPPKDKRRFEHKNVTWAGPIRNADLMPHLTRHRLGVIPFKNLSLVAAVDPIKYYDHLAAGLPTVAAHLPELEGRPYATVTYSKREFLRAVDAAMAHVPERAVVRYAARNETAQARGETLIGWLQDCEAW